MADGGAITAMPPITSVIPSEGRFSEAYPCCDKAKPEPRDPYVIPLIQTLLFEFLIAQS